MNSLPPAFVAQMQALLPDYADFAAALDTPAPVSIRINPFKTLPPAQGLPWCPNALTLAARPLFALDPRWHAGAYYVQDASCMLLEAVLKQLDLRPNLILDACAAPGGKASHLAALYPDALVLANEVIRSRAAILSENLSKWGSDNLAISQLDPSALAALPDSFDLVLADVPCSGEGLFRKDLAARQEWSPEQVQLCVGRQQRILTELWTCLKPGGLLIYSTCTYNRAENEEQSNWLQAEHGAEPVAWRLPPDWPIVQQAGSLRCYPHRISGEGFFLTVLRKPEGPITRLKPARLETLPARESQSLQAWLTAGDYSFGRRGELLLAWPQRHREAFERLSRLKSLSYGLPLAEVKGKQGKDLRPTPELALSTILEPTAFSSLDLELPQALAFLRREALYDLPNSPRGDAHTLVRFAGWPLGWIKRVENRGNNLYPQAWRLRMQASPTDTQQWEKILGLLPLAAR